MKCIEFALLQTRNDTETVDLDYDSDFHTHRITSNVYRENETL